MPLRFALPRWAVATNVVLFSVVSHAGAPNVKGKITGQEKLLPDVYAEAARPEAHRWTWREPSPSVQSQFRVLSANPSRDVCIAAMTGGNAGPQEPIRMTVTGGRVFPTTIVVSPGTPLAFKNFDPFKHRLYVVGNANFRAEDLGAGQVRSWSASGPGKYEIRDELFPTVRTFVVVDAQVVQVAYPGHDGAFGFSLPAGEYVLKAFFQGKHVGKSTPITARERSTLDVKEALQLGGGVSEGQDSK
jgi:hypothetical protein